MAFINERISDGERKEYLINGNRRVKPKYWTIDRERKIKFFDYWTNIDEPEQKYFALVIEENVYDILLRRELNSEPESVVWNLIYIRWADEQFDEKEYITDSLREALRTYGVSGFEYGKVKPIDIIINF